MYNSYDFVVFLDADWNILGKRNRQHFLIPEIARLIEDKGSVLAIERPVCLVTGLYGKGQSFFGGLSVRKYYARKQKISLFIPRLFFAQCISCFGAVVAKTEPSPYEMAD